MFRKFAAAAAMVAALVMGTGAQAGSNDLSTADSKTMHDYVLSMDKVKGMQGALDDFKTMASSGLQKQQKDIGDSSKSIAEMISKVNANAPMMAIYRKHGLNAQDAVVMPFVLMYAGMCVQYPAAAPKLAQQTSPAQIAFYKTHQKELQAIPFLGGK